MASRLAVALLVSLLVTIVWTAPRANSRTTPPVPTASLEMASTAATPTASDRSASPDSGPGFKIVPVSQLVKTAKKPSAPYPILRRYGPKTSTAAQTTSSRAPRTPLTTAAPKVALYNNLNGQGLDSSANNQGVHPAPPDSTGAIGPSNYVEMVNSQIGVYNRSLLLTTMTNLGSLINDPFNTSYCDPQIQWDPTANRWLYLFLFCNTSDPANQYFIFAWSRTASPTPLLGGWCPFGIQTNPYFLDYPKLGHDGKYMIIGGNMFDTSISTTNPPFASARIVWIAMPANGVTSCPASVTFDYTAGTLFNGDGATPTFTPVPVNTTTGSTNGYIVSAYDPSSGAQSKVAVWHLDSSGVLHGDSDITVESFSLPASAPQLGSTNTIDTLDGRLTQAVGDPTTGIWTQHTVAGPGGRSMVAWYEIKVAGSSASLANSGNIGSTTDFVFNGAVSPRADAGGAAVIYNRSSATIDPVIAAEIRFTATSSGNMEPGELVLGTSPAADTDGTCNLLAPGVPCRWGDYAGASPDPVVKNVVWGTSELNTAATGSTPAWTDRNFALAFVTKPVAPTAVSATPSNGAGTVSWTASTYVPSSPVTSYTITAYVGPTATLQEVVAAPATSAHFGGLANGTTYTFTVFATNDVGNSPESVHSNAITPGRQVGQAPPPSPAPARSPVAQSTPNPSPRPRP